MKTYAILMTWEQMDWLPWAIKQLNTAIEFGSIDKVLIAEGGHSKNMSGRSSDGSWEYLHDTIGKNKNYEIFDAVPFRDKHPRYDVAQADLLNTMCSQIPVGSKDSNWIWYLHDDEFFFNDFLKNIKNIIMSAERHNWATVMTRQLSFSFNMKLHHLNRTAFLLNKWEKGTFWKPTSTLCYPDKSTYLSKKDKIEFNEHPDFITFHFNRVKTIARERMRYELSKEKGTDAAMEWFNKIWLAADLSELEKIYEVNKQLTGHYGYTLDSPDMGKAVWQELLTYNGKYPEVLQDHPYKFITDVRTI